jgi:hypothetical protein
MDTDDKTTVELRKSTRNRLRRYKAHDGRSYDDAITDLLDSVGWEVEETDEWK